VVWVIRRFCELEGAAKLFRLEADSAYTMTVQLIFRFVLENWLTHLVEVAVEICVTVGVVHFVVVTVLTVLTVWVVCTALMPKTFKQYFEAPGEILSA
jgi:sensor histidine kinase YesM